MLSCVLLFTDAFGEAHLELELVFIVVIFIHNTNVNELINNINVKIMVHSVNWN